MYREAEVALQRKIKEVEEKIEQEKQEEIKRIESTFVDQIDAVKHENENLAKEVSISKVSQQQIQKDKEEAQKEICRMKEEIVNIDKKRDEEIFLIKEQEKKEKEKQTKLLEKKEREFQKRIELMLDTQTQNELKYKKLESQKLSNVSEAKQDHNTLTLLEVQKIMETMSGKTKTSDKQEHKFEQQLKQLEEDLRHEKDKSNALLQTQLDFKTALNQKSDNKNDGCILS